MKIVFLLLVTLSLYSNDVLTNYRMNGINAIEKQMDFDLTKAQYWSEHIKDIDTTFGYLESNPNILTCNKENSTLNLYVKDTNNSYGFQNEYSAFTGKIKGDKVKEGDLKTPVGIYQITKKLTKENKLDSFYGPLAFVTSYPNTYDKYRGKNGHGIWIHGLPTEQKRDEFTKGCIAINNSNIEGLNEIIDIDNTLLIINTDEVKKGISKETLATLLSQLYSWRYSWLFDDINGYLAFYSSDFVRSDGMKFDRFKKYKTRVFKKIEKKTIIFNSINVIPYPNTDNIYQITFKELYKSDTFKFSGDKTLVVKLDETKSMKILTEK
ncbi:L,D-transpeptidase family protein [Sulfurimonas sp.]|uniref:L,D-transpeptidase family protein n=1 Tax=Sulfurimonas sp. TaxID=2022749 RepID=UPI0025E5425D|nr:L,D-transpeptidase family protein [Sulfurimonas sp.]